MSSTDRAEATAESLQAARRLERVAQKLRSAVVTDPEKIEDLFDEANQCWAVVRGNYQASKAGGV